MSFQSDYTNVLNSPIIANLLKKLDNSVLSPFTLQEEKELIVCATWLATLVNSRDHIFNLAGFFDSSDHAIDDKEMEELKTALKTRYEATGSKIDFKYLRKYVKRIDGTRASHYKENIPHPFTIERYFRQYPEEESPKFYEQVDLLAGVVEELAKKVKMD